MYRGTRARFSATWLGPLLMGLRAMSVFVVLLLLLEPILTAFEQESYPPLIVLLQDDSESLVARGDSNAVRSQHPARMQALADQLRAQGAQVVPYLFSQDIVPKSLDSLTFGQTGTQIGTALEKISQRYAHQNLAGVVLVSDGIITGGTSARNAAQHLKAPIHTVLMGDTIRPKDQLIEAVLHNKISYQNTETPILVNLLQHGYESSSIQASLYKDGRLLASQTASLSRQKNTAQLSFNVKLESAGIQAYDIVISRKPDEVSYLNNQQRIYIQVLENRFRIALFAGGPHPDIGALRKTFSEQQQYEFVSFIRENSQQFDRQPDDLAKYELILLHNFPTSTADKAILDQIYAQVQRKGTPLVHFIGGQTRLNVHPEQAQYMGLSPTRAVGTLSEAFFYTIPAYRGHSTFRFDDPDAFAAWLQSAPPILRNESEWKLNPGTQVVGKAQIKNIALEYPLLALQEHQGHKTATFVCENIWRWRVHNYVLHEDFALFDSWMQNLADWLTTRNDQRRFRVYPLRQVFSGSERVIFNGEVYDDSNKPVTGAEVKMTLKDERGVSTDYYLVEEQAGSYGLAISNLTAGSYTYTAEGALAGQALGRDAGQFSIGKSAIEYRDLKADADLMRQLSLQTGGLFSYVSQLPSLADRIKQTGTLVETLETKRATRSLQQYVWPLLLLLALLSAEWILRKRNSLS